jgi:acyl carrier protein
MDEIKDQLRQFLHELLPSGESLNLLDSTPLLTSGILDSMGMLRIVEFVEQKFGIQVDEYDTGIENFDRIDDMVAFVQRKQGMTR